MSYQLRGGLTKREYLIQLGARVAKLRAEGLSLSTIALRLGVSSGAVTRARGHLAAARGRGR